MKGFQCSCPQCHFLLLLLVFVIATSALDTIGENEQVVLCGGKLNPREFAAATRTATDILLSCKTEIVELNAKPRVIYEAKRGCAVLRLCYAYAGNASSLAETRNKVFWCIEKLFMTADAISPELFPGYGVTVPDVMKSLNKCAKRHLPRQEKYLLATISYLVNFVTG